MVAANFLTAWRAHIGLQPAAGDEMLTRRG
jgi:hypothetical protein